jgi:excisionase family DNA binding protein
MVQNSGAATSERNRQRLTTKQLAQKFQVTTRTIQAWRDSGKLPYIRINSRLIRYDEDAIDRALANGK